MPDLFDQVTEITGWLDAANPRSPHQDAMRVLKLTEEAGEAAAAYLGMTGQNPRKGVTHTRADLLTELADVALAALVAIATFTPDTEAARAVMTSRTHAVHTRAGLTTG